MKNTEKKQEIIFKLPEEIAGEIGFSKGDRLKLHVMPQAAVTTKSVLTATELIQAVAGLSELSTRLTVALAKACGQCDGCGKGYKNPAEGVMNCTICQSILDRDEVYIPADILAEAGIPEGAKLEVYADEESGLITVEESEEGFDIRDVPPQILEMLALSGVCLAELEELVILEETVYGK